MMEIINFLWEELKQEVSNAPLLFGIGSVLFIFLYAELWRKMKRILTECEKIRSDLIEIRIRSYTRPDLTEEVRKENEKNPVNWGN